jgi:alpha/beta superfamily hydrolase
MATTHESRNFFLDGPAGRLEAILWSPVSGEKPPLAALVCHPHPLFGGTMHNKVAYQAAKSLDQFGLPVLRFNFRGAGKSAGAYDQGRGELGDVRAALDFLTDAFPDLLVLLAGFSFGSWVGLRVGCEDSRVAELIGMGVPVNDSDFSYLSGCKKSKLFVQGSKDQFGAPDRLKNLVASLPGDNRLIAVNDADHFFTGKLDQLGRAIADWLTERHPHPRKQT